MFVVFSYVHLKRISRLKVVTYINVLNIKNIITVRHLLILISRSNMVFHVLMFARSQGSC